MIPRGPEVRFWDMSPPGNLRDAAEMATHNTRQRRLGSRLFPSAEINSGPARSRSGGGFEYVGSAFNRQRALSASEYFALRAEDFQGMRVYRSEVVLVGAQKVFLCAPFIISMSLLECGFPAAAGDAKVLGK